MLAYFSDLQRWRLGSSRWGQRHSARRWDPEGAGLVPDAAAALLSDGGTVAGIVRRYDRVVERFEACRAVKSQ